MNILVPNLCSTSLKYQILEMPAEARLAKGRLERVADYAEAVRGIQDAVAELGVSVDAVAFKAVHGGPRYRGTFLVDGSVLGALEEFLPAAPAHNRIYLDAMRAFAAHLPGVPLVAAFETEFHSTMPDYAREYGVPAEWREAGVVKYGFHGASHSYVAARVAEWLGPAARLVSCHLGGSSSICATSGGRSVDTTMGFSPQSGLENATRHGDLDVFAALFMMEKRGWSLGEVRGQLARTGGLAGLSGIAGGDVRDLESAAAAGNARAATALEVFVYQVKKTIGAYAAAMGGLDAIAFTGGIGENSSALRKRCCAGLEFLGVALDAHRNESESGDRLLSPDGARPAVYAVAADEERVVARRAYAILTARR